MFLDDTSLFLVIEIIDDSGTDLNNGFKKISE